MRGIIKAVLVLVAVGGLAPLSVRAADPFPVQGNTQGYEIIINLPARELHLYEHGVPVKRYPIGVGRIVSASHLGSTQIINRVVHPTYYPPDWYTRGLAPIPPGPGNPVGTRWLGLGWSGYGIHGTHDPASIGTLASAGCIRMHNADVEELADLVGVGTPVTFVYESIEVGHDPLSHRPLLRVHPDIYRMGTNSLAHALRILAEHGVAPSGVSEIGLTFLLNEARGTWSTLPVAVPVAWEGQELVHAGFQVGTKRYVSLHRLTEQLGETMTWERPVDQVLVNGRALQDPVWVGDELFASPGSVAVALGLDWSATSEKGHPAIDTFSAITLTFGGVALPDRAYLEHRWLMVPLDALVPMVDVEVGWDTQWQTVLVADRPVFGGRLIGGRYYLPHDRVASLLGLTIDWRPGEGRAVVRASQ